MAWAPAALSQPPVAYPQYPFPNANPAAKKTGTHAGARDRYLAAKAPTFSFTDVPMGQWAGTGSYFPGHAGEDAQMAKYKMQQAMQQSPGAMAQGRMQARSGGAAGASGNGLFDSFQQARNAANQANEARYQDTLTGANELATRSMGYLDGIGAQQQADVDQAYKRQAANLQQSMINRGLSNSTVADTMQMGNERERMAEQRRLQADLNQQRLGTDMATTQNILRLMESKTDEGPSYELLAQLAQQMGQGGVGAGGGVEYVSPQSLGFNIPGQGGGQIGYQGQNFGSVPMEGLSRSQQTQAMRRQQSLARADERRRFGGGLPVDYDAIAARDGALLSEPLTFGGFPIGGGDPMAGPRAHLDRLRAMSGGPGTGRPGYYPSTPEEMLAAGY